MAAHPSSRAMACFVGHPAPARLAEPGDPTGLWLRRLGAVGTGVVVITSAFEASRLTVRGSEDRALARRVIEHLLAGGQTAAVDDRHLPGDDARVAASLIGGGRELPVVQVSLHASLDPELHLGVGRALEPLRDEGVVILGCGALGRDAARGGRARGGQGVTSTFHDWVVDLLTRTGPYARSRGLTRFRDHPEAHRVQPRGEHVLPLLVVAGAATSDRSPENVGELAHSAATAGSDAVGVGSALGIVFRR